MCCFSRPGLQADWRGGGGGGVTGGMDGGDDYYYHCTRIDGGARFEGGQSQHCTLSAAAAQRRQWSTVQSGSWLTLGLAHCSTTPVLRRPRAFQSLAICPFSSRKCRPLSLIHFSGGGQPRTGWSRSLRPAWCKRCHSGLVRLPRIHTYPYHR